MMAVSETVVGVTPVEPQAVIREYGDRFAKVGRVVDPLVTGVEFACSAVRPEKRRLTDSEVGAWTWLCQEFDFARGRPWRVTFGVDFAYGRVGFEVKSSRSYRLTDNQLAHIAELPFTFVVVSTGDGVWIEDCYVEPEQTVRVTV